jgi:hypothetical protein
MVNNNESTKENKIATALAKIRNANKSGVNGAIEEASNAGATNAEIIAVVKSRSKRAHMRTNPNGTESVLSPNNMMGGRRKSRRTRKHRKQRKHRSTRHR